MPKLNKLLRLPRKFRTALRLPLGQKAMAAEALVLLAAARIAVLGLPFRWVARVLGRQDQETPAQEEPANAALVRQVSLVVLITSRNVPWTSKCLDQALAAKVMLARRGVTATAYFGVKNGPRGQLAAHAWLRSGKLYVTGGRNRRRFTVINTFA